MSLRSLETLDMRAGRLVLAAAGAAALLLTSCAELAGPATGSLSPAQPQPAKPEKGAAAPVDIGPLAAAHKTNPADPVVALAYARALRAGGAKAEALTVLDAAGKAKPDERRIALERGLLALELGETGKAETLLRRAHDPKAPDWRLHSALGAALASRGKQQEAQVQFAKALALAPEHPTILNNLALSYALDGKAEKAEKLLRRVQRSTPRDPQDAGKVAQNLALVLGLRGKYEEARTLAQSTLPAAKAGDNVAYLKKLAEDRTAVARASATTAEPPGKAAAVPGAKAATAVPAAAPPAKAAAASPAAPPAKAATTPAASKATAEPDPARKTAPVSRLRRGEEPVAGLTPPTYKLGAPRGAQAD
jgi:Flp pilus assembly protein TadD